MSFSVRFVFVLIFVILCSGFASAQITTGAITGTVFDASGAPIPDVVVKVTDEGTQIERSAKTDATGNYSISLLPLGTYSLRVEVRGFETEIRSGVHVLVDEAARVDFSLQPGTVQQVAEVSGTPPPLQTENGEIGGVVDHQQVVELPLNGRDFLQLVALEPGGVSVAKQPGGGLSFFSTIFGGVYSVHGAPAEGTNYTLDGLSMRDVVDTRVGFEMTVDAIQEFKFEALNYSAAFGRASGGQINIVSRGGSNQFHGAAWEFLRNDVVDARSFFNLQKPPYKQNQFGGDGGGAIIKDKLFFFATYEGFRSIKGLSSVVSVPTVAERDGNFAGGATIYDPLSINPATGLRQPFPGNQIPASRQSQVALNALALLYPLPNLASSSLNLNGEANQQIYTDQGNIRVDYHPTLADSFFLRLTDVRADRSVPFEFSSLPNVSSVWNSPAKNGVVGFTHVFGPTAVNDFRFGANQFVQVLQDAQQNVFINKEIGITGLSTDPRLQGNPTIAISGLASTGAIVNAPNNRTDDAYEWLDNFSKVHGSHTFTMGGLAQHNEQNGAANLYSHGDFSFNGAFTSELSSAGAIVSGTGNPVADFLLGFPISSARCCVQSDAFRNFANTEYGVYFQDDWKVNSHLTINLGARWEYFQPPYEIRNRFSMPDLGAAPETAILLAGQNGVSRSLRDGGDLKDWQPRVGFAYSLGHDGKTVIRGGYGIFFEATNFVYTFNMASNPPFTDSTSFLSSTVTPLLTLANPFPTGLGIPSESFTAIDGHYRDPYNENLNFGLQRDIGFGTVVSASYIENHGVALPDIENANAPAAGPGSVNARRPIPGLSSISIRRNRGASDYDALELKAEKRFAGNLSFLGSYVWSKCIDDPGISVIGDGSPNAIRDPADNSLNRGLCTSNVESRFAANFSYQLPFGRHFTGAKRALLSAWQLNSIIDVETGQPFSVLVGYDNSNTGLNLDTPGVVAGQNPNDGPKTPQEWFNKAAFTSPIPFTYGQAGRDIVVGPGTTNVDFAVHKNFPLTERQNIEFRTELFNIFNHPNFYQPGNTYGTPSFGVIGAAADGRDIQFSLKYSF